MYIRLITADQGRSTTDMLTSPQGCDAPNNSVLLYVSIGCVG